MDKLFGVLEVVLPVVALVLIGIFIRRKKMVSEQGMSEIKTLIMNFCLPAMLFNTFYAIRFTWREGIVLLTLALVTLLAFIAGRFICPLLGIRQRIAPYLCTTVEGGSIGYALFILLFGQEHLYHIALLDVGNALTQWSLVMTSLALLSQGKSSRKELVRSVITPINISIALGVLFSVTRLGPALSATPAGHILEAVLNLVSAPVGAVIIISVGFGLTLTKIEWHDTIRGIAARAGIYTVIGLALCAVMFFLFPEDPLYRYASVLFALLPPTYAYSVYAKGESEQSYVGAVLGLYTILTIIGFTVFAWILA